MPGCRRRLAPKRRARELVDTYLTDWDHELEQIWEVERPFQLHLGEVTVSGRADVILDCSGGQERLTIVDYKTAEGEQDGRAFPAPGLRRCRPP